jgi:hypothetical protein
MTSRFSCCFAPRIFTRKIQKETTKAILISDPSEKAIFERQRSEGPEANTAYRYKILGYTVHYIQHRSVGLLMTDSLLCKEVTNSRYGQKICS